MTEKQSLHEVRHVMADAVRALARPHNANATTRLLLHGPVGSGKAAAVALLAQEAKRAVIRVSLRDVISKYIGETEKNLKRLIDQAEHDNAILFFDEADALFGKRTEVKDAHDKYANQEIAYVLQRLEAYRGVLVMATNTRPAPDDPLLRRMLMVIPFPVGS